MRRSTPQLERGFGRDRFDVGNATHAVGAKNLCRGFHALTETLRCHFVNGKVSAFIGWSRSLPGMLCPLDFDFFFLRVQFVDFAMKRASADSEFFGGRGHVSVRGRERL